MRYLLDECLCEQATNAMEALRKPADHFAYIAGHEVAHAGAQDPEIPVICKDLGWDVLLTANVRDFGARKVLYQSLLAEGIHVLVVRPGKQKLDEFLQVSLLARHYPKFSAKFEVATGPLLVVARESGIKERDLDELIAEIEAAEQGRILP